MGLDAWLMAKTKTVEPTKDNSATSICGGLFGIVPKAVSDDVQLCYLRKGYDQSQLILNTVKDNRGEDYTCHISKDEIEELLKEAKRILATHTFDDEGYDTTEDDPHFEAEEPTFVSNKKWQALIEGLEKAKKIFEEDLDADIYYHEWF